MWERDGIRSAVLVYMYAACEHMHICSQCKYVDGCVGGNKSVFGSTGAVNSVCAFVSNVYAVWMLHMYWHAVTACVQTAHYI